MRYTLAGDDFSDDPGNRGTSASQGLRGRLAKFSGPYTGLGGKSVAAGLPAEFRFRGSVVLAPEVRRPADPSTALSHEPRDLRTAHSRASYDGIRLFRAAGEQLRGAGCVARGRCSGISSDMDGRHSHRFGFSLLPVVFRAEGAAHRGASGGYRGGGAPGRRGAVLVRRDRSNRPG